MTSTMRGGAANDRPRQSAVIVVMWCAVAVLFGLLLVAAMVLAWQMLPASEENHASPVGPSISGSGDQEKSTSVTLQRGAQLVRAGNCLGCHTARGGAEFAGGRRISTGFGDFITPNITSDPTTGMGNWSAEDFWQALHHGRGRDGRFLYPAFPYPDYTRVSRADADAMFAWLRTVPAVLQPSVPHELAFPFNQRLLLGFWRALYFRPGVYIADRANGVEWNRGAYLVQGLGHCSACHAQRNALGATSRELSFSGAVMPGHGWYAPPLHGGPGDGLGRWSTAELAELLHTGINTRSAAHGPMAEVVRQSLQYLPRADVLAMAVYLKSLPPPAEPSASSPVVGKSPRLQAVLEQGQRLYEKQCASCHQSSGEGEPRRYPALVGSSSVTAASPVNAVRMVLNGGFAPGTAGNPRPHGMPPFGPFMSDEEVAAVVTYLRYSWGNRREEKSAEVSPAEVNRYRAIPFE